MRGKEREWEQILICLHCKIHGFGIYASHNRMLWERWRSFFPNISLVWFVWADCIQMSRYFQGSELLPNFFVNFNTICSSAFKMGWIVTYCTYLLTIHDIEPCSDHQNSLTSFRIVSWNCTSCIGLSLYLVDRSVLGSPIAEVPPVTTFPCYHLIFCVCVCFFYSWFPGQFDLW